MLVAKRGQIIAQLEWRSKCFDLKHNGQNLPRNAGSAILPAVVGE